jgi:ArsR family transcriptional regulator
VEASNLLETSRDAAGGSAEAFAALGDPARLAILRELQSGTTCICELSPRLGMAPNLLSYHLRMLREAGLVEGERRGRRVDYRVRRTALRELAVELIGLAIGDEAGADAG